MQAENVGKESWLREAGGEECDVWGRWQVAQWLSVAAVFLASGQQAVDQVRGEKQGS